jgi:hypothetical protein
MKKILHRYPIVVMIALLIIFVGILISFYVWGIGDIFSDIDQALVSPPSQSSGSFDLPGAAKLDLHGLVSTSTAPAAASATY